MVGIIIVITAILFFVTANIVYKQLEKTKIIPIKYHPYTNLKTKEFYWEFIRVYFFFVCTIVFLISGYFAIFLGLLIITIFQLLAAYTIHKQNSAINKERIEVNLDEDDLEEQRVYILSLKSNERKKIVHTKKIVLYNEYLYFSKNKKILTRERMYKYLYLNSIKKNENLITIKYGFLGLPMFKKLLYIPRKKEKAVINILHQIEKSRRNTTFTQRYFKIFKNTNK